MYSTVCSIKSNLNVLQVEQNKQKETQVRDCQLILFKFKQLFLGQNYDSGRNFLLNRQSHLNGKIKKSWLEQSLDTFKIKFKELFLTNQ